MKKLISLFTAFLLLCSVSVCSMALDGNISFPSDPMFYQKEGNSFIGELKTSALTDQQKDFMRAWYASDSNLLVYNRGRLNFFIFSSDTIIVSANVGSLGWGTLQFKNGMRFSQMVFDVTNGDLISGNKCNTSGTSNYSKSKSAGFGTFVCGTIFNKFSVIPPVSACLNYIGDLYILDDGGLLETPPPEEPESSSSEPESSSSEPESSSSEPESSSKPEYNTDWFNPFEDFPEIYDSNAFSIFSKSMKVTLGGISNSGLRVLGVLFSVILIGSIFRNMFLDKLRFETAVSNKQFQRRVRFADRQRNFDHIVNDKVDEMEINMAAKSRFRRKFWWAELEEAVHRREISAEAEKEYHKRNPGAYSDRRELYRKLNEEYYSGRWLEKKSDSDVIIAKGDKGRKQIPDMIRRDDI